MPHQKSSDYKETAVQYYLVEDKSQEEVCKIFKCSRRSLMRWVCLLYTSPSPRDRTRSRMPSSA